MRLGFHDISTVPLILLLGECLRTIKKWIDTRGLINENSYYGFEYY
jgi:hypothetical protein